MSERQRFGLDSVLRHEEPAGKSYVNFGLRVADRGVGCLHAERLNELQQGVAKGHARLSRPAQFCGWEWTDPSRAPGYRWSAASGDCRARSGARSFLRGRSIRPRLPCRCAERRRPMRSPSRENRPLRSSCWAFSSIFRNSRVTGSEVRREQIEVARRKGRKQSIVAVRHRALLALRREHRALSHRRLGVGPQSVMGSLYSLPTTMAMRQFVARQFVQSRTRHAGKRADNGNVSRAVLIGRRELHAIV